MATTSMWKIKKRLDIVLDYTNNPEKTVNENYGKELYCDLHDSIDYIKNGEKTEKLFYLELIVSLKQLLKI